MSNQSNDHKSVSSPRKIPSTESFLSEHKYIKPSHEENTPKVLPPSMRHVFQQNTTKVLRRIRSQLSEFTTFVEDVQKKTPSEQQLFPVPLPEALKHTASSTIRPVHPVDPRPKNAPLRDAFQMVRNLLWRISNVIDQVAANIPAEDDQRINVQTPHFDYYYAQYVFQLELYILQTVGEQLEQFSIALAEISVNDAILQLPVKVDEVDTNLSSHTIFPGKNGIFPDYEASPKSSGTSCEESSSSASECSLPKVELKKPAVDALELLMFLSEKMCHYFQEKGLTEFDKIQKKEFSKKALGIPDLCKSCSNKVAQQLRRYSSRENLYAEKYEKSSDESVLSKDYDQKRKGRRAHFDANTRESYFTSDSKPIDIHGATKSRAYLYPKPTVSANTGIQMTYLKRNDPIKSPSHGEPLISAVAESAAVINQLKGPDDVIVGVFKVTEDPEKPEGIVLPKQSDDIHFSLAEFCSLLKEQFRKLLTAESDKTQSKHTDSNVIANILIQCFREASRSVVESFNKPNSIWLDVTAHTSRDADVESNVNEKKPSEKEDFSVNEHEKQLDTALEQFVKDSYNLARSALEKKKNNKGSISESK